MSHHADERSFPSTIWAKHPKAFTAWNSKRQTFDSKLWRISIPPRVDLSQVVANYGNVWTRFRYQLWYPLPLFTKKTCNQYYTRWKLSPSNKENLLINFFVNLSFVRIIIIIIITQCISLIENYDQGLRREGSWQLIPIKKNAAKESYMNLKLENELMKECYKEMTSRLHSGHWRGFEYNVYSRYIIKFYSYVRICFESI